MDGSILASAGRPLWRYLESKNMDAAALFRQHGLDPALIHETRTRYSYASLCEAWVAAAAITADDHIGLESAKHYRLLDLNALGITFLSSETLDAAFQRLMRYESVINSDLTFCVEQRQHCVDLISDLPDIPADAVRIMEDSRNSVVLNLCRRGLDMSLDPVEVAFTYPEPALTGEYFAVFRCPIKFSQPAPRLSFASADMQRHFTAANRDLALCSDKILEEMSREQNQSDIVSQVKKAIMHDLPSGTPSEESIAQRVLLSSRTLQRRLSNEHTNFRALVLEVRRELAQKYLQDKTMPLAEISYMLGFADTSSFSRAFKQWTGDPPAVFRSNLLA